MEVCDDIDFGALSDMNLSPPGNAHAAPVETPVGLVNMDGPTHAVYAHFMECHGAWLSCADRAYALTVIFKSEQKDPK